MSGVLTTKWRDVQVVGMGSPLTKGGFSWP
jgi:hypothetical protein